MRVRLGLGCVTFGREIGEDQSFALLDHAFEHGIRTFDTAEAYGDGASEAILGRWIEQRGVRPQVTVVTKILKAGNPSHVRTSLAASLERLRTNTIDVYLLHQYDSTQPLAATLEALQAAAGSGHVQSIGASNFSQAQLEEAAAITARRQWTALTVLQPPYNLVSREIEKETLPWCKEHGIEVMTYSPLAAGFLTGKYRPCAPIPQGTRFDIKPAHQDVYFSASNFAAVEKLRQLSVTSGLPMSRLALGWVMRNRLIGTVLIGARTQSHIDTALEAAAHPLPELFSGDLP